MAKLSDKQRKQIIVEYIAGDGKISQSLLAKRYGVSQKTISSILCDGKTSQKVYEKKKENEMSMLAFLDSRSSKAQSLIDKVLETLPSDFEKSSRRDKAGLLEILSEVFMPKKEEEMTDSESEGFVITIEDYSDENVSDPKTV